MNLPLAWSEACDRNKQPILEVLLEVLPSRGRILEIGSATGQHVVHFAAALPGWVWQPSDQAAYLPDLEARLRAEGGVNIEPAITLDVARDFPEGPYDAVYSSNTSHIMSWPEVQAMFAGVGGVLRVEGLFCLYGPFNENGEFTAPSNAAFDRQLRQRNPSMGLRDLADLETLGRQHHLFLQQRFPLPANNQLLVFVRRPESASTRTDGKPA
ncbi:DUF938 domain-containing protein [Elongatibacter sediminis]|uniref:DUF938 domain-containing protein n=1 Tax=Elongatibacter sediminis TaxID=3119006 RepID=A0AAW9RKM2_9GAMM